ncbi:hypothetical protein JYP52_02450 [Nitratireductor aquibiodomus]|uniref:hypothetical protein n=1 Tax=Nitratireductor aquibiodomus TaxID=204799 RepID=UPI0019D356FB|nr:hypothetical protein [Nitratireductor aquibiodomus]MBN7759982.1 hypothetical protein [Nitratireductor aquibiodomus]
MFAVEPYIADRFVIDADEGGWKQCRVIGVSMQDGAPQFVIEVSEAGETWLTTADTIRKRP